jgi:hypothetical protein
MNATLKKFITTYISLSDAELGEIAGRFRPKSVKKNDFLLKQGGICTDLLQKPAYLETIPQNTLHPSSASHPHRSAGSGGNLPGIINCPRTTIFLQKR